MRRARQWFSKLLYKQNADMIEYVLLLSILICGALATATTLTHQIRVEFNFITNHF
jgi:Flp pilus assembly pilin Flp